MNIAVLFGSRNKGHANIKGFTVKKYSPVYRLNISHKVISDFIYRCLVVTFLSILYALGPLAISVPHSAFLSTELKPDDLDRLLKIAGTVAGYMPGHVAGYMPGHVAGYMPGHVKLSSFITRREQETSTKITNNVITKKQHKQQNTRQQLNSLD